jgi:hypothetical protein
MSLKREVCSWYFISYLVEFLSARHNACSVSCHWCSEERERERKRERERERERALTERLDLGALWWSIHLYSSSHFNTSDAAAERSNGVEDQKWHQWSYIDLKCVFSNARVCPTMLQNCQILFNVAKRVWSADQSINSNKNVLKSRLSSLVCRCRLKYVVVLCCRRRRCIHWRVLPATKRAGIFAVATMGDFIAYWICTSVFAL